MPIAPWIFELGAFLFGLLLGSFLNVCISRLPEHRSISKPRSHCPKCLETIRWYDNIPLLSWVLLRARCRHCKQRISWRYPLVELAIGLWTALAASPIAYSYRREMDMLRELSTQPHMARVDRELTQSLLKLYEQSHGSTWIFAVTLLLIGFLLIGLVVMDWQTHVLPDTFTLTGIALGFLLICTEAIFLPSGADDVHFNPQSKMRLNSPGSFAARGDVFLTGPEHLVFGRIAAILGAAFMLLLVRWLYRALRKRDGMGLGDVKLLAMIAAFLGFGPAMLAMFLGVLLCAGYAVVLLARRRADLATQLPLGSFLAAGGLLTAVIGEPLLSWYRGLL